MKEVEEETGIECEVVQLIAVLDGLRQRFTRIPLYSLVFHCRATGGELKAHPLETDDVGWFSLDDLPPMTVGVDQWGELARQALSGGPVDVHYDRPRITDVAGHARRLTASVGAASASVLVAEEALDLVDEALAVAEAVGLLVVALLEVGHVLGGLLVLERPARRPGARRRRWRTAARWCRRWCRADWHVRCTRASAAFGEGADGT